MMPNDLRFCCGAAAAQPPRRARKNGIPAAAATPRQRGPASSKRGLCGWRHTPLQLGPTAIGRDPRRVSDDLERVGHAEGER